MSEPSTQPTLVTSPEEFLYLLKHRKPGPFKVENLFGRICKGRNLDEMKQLTDDPEDKTAFLFGEDGVEKILELVSRTQLSDQKLTITKDEALHIFHLIGFEEHYVREKIAHQVKFEMIIFDRKSIDELGSDVEPADWNGTRMFVKHLFPKVYPLFEKHFDKLQTTPFDEIQAQGFNLGDVRRCGSKHPLYFKGEERFLSYCEEKQNRNEEITLFDIRAFLYFACGMRELYNGDGYTLTEHGQRGLREYLTQNIERGIIKDHVIVSLDI